MKTNIQYQLVVGTVLLLLVAGQVWNCAAVAPPSGGPKDETPPQLLSVTPPTETLQIAGGLEIRLVFSEYIDEKTITTAFHLSPLTDEDIQLDYEDDEVIVTLPDSLIENQTYILTVSRELKDEHGVPLAVTVQLAYSTGDRIEQGSISGELFFNTGPMAVHLWDLGLVERDSFFTRKPHFRIDASDDGSFEFNYLRPAEYGILAIEQSGAGLGLDQARFSYGVYREMLVDLRQDSLVTGIDIPVWREPQELKLLRGEWIGPSWGRLYFNNLLISEPDRFAVGLLDTIVSGVPADLILDPLDSTAVLVIAPDSLPAGKLAIEMFSVNDIYEQLLDTATLEMKIPADYDSTYLEVLWPEKNFVHQIESPVLKIILNKPLVDSVYAGAVRLLLFDSLEQAVTVSHSNFTGLEITPLEPWQEQGEYRLELQRDSIRAVDGSRFADSLITLPFKISRPVGFGGLAGSFNSIRTPIAIRLKGTENTARELIYLVNSDLVFSQDNIPEGFYSLMMFHDANENQRFDYGQAVPYIPAEWFYLYPDTIEVRANWVKELTPIDFREEQ